MTKCILTILCKFNTIYQRIIGYLLLFTGFGDCFWKESSWCTEKSFTTFWRVFTIAEPQEKRQPLYGTCRMPVTGFRLLVMPFEMLHTFENYWLLTVQAERFLLWETQNTAYRITIHKWKFWISFPSPIWMNGLYFRHTNSIVYNKPQLSFTDLVLSVVWFWARERVFFSV